MFTTSTMRIQANFRRNTLLKTLTVLYAAIWIAMAINPVFPSDWLLENILVIVFIPILVFTYRIFPLSDLSYLCITLFMMLHALGAHYTYSEVPIGFWMKDTFDLSRNHFDRLVHFSFGLLLAYPIREVFLRVASARGFWAYYLPLDVTLAFSAVYEIIEMIVAKIVSSGAGDAYLGTQGDIWDAQMDMGAAALGALISMTVTMVLRRIIPRQHVVLNG